MRDETSSAKLSFSELRAEMARVKGRLLKVAIRAIMRLASVRALVSSVQVSEAFDLRRREMEAELLQELTETIAFLREYPIESNDGRALIFL